MCVSGSSLLEWDQNNIAAILICDFDIQRRRLVMAISGQTKSQTKKKNKRSREQLLRKGTQDLQYRIQPYLKLNI